MSLGVGIIGLGTVGGGVYKLLTEHRFQKIHLVGVYNRSKKKYHLLDIKPSLCFPSLEALLTCDKIDVIVETIGGIGTAKKIIEKSLRNGKHVVTANKDLIVAYGKDLLKIAVKNGVRLEFSASVCGGIPVFSNLRCYRSVDNILSVYGIFNGTTNFILSLMSEKEISFEKCLEIARNKGYAEANSEKDIEGFDAAYKLAIITWVTYGYLPSLNEFSIRGISSITKSDIKMLHTLGYVPKLISYVTKNKKRVRLFVSPMAVRKDSLLANINGENNAVVIEREYVGRSTLIGKGAGRFPTAAAIVSDIMNIADGEYILENRFEGSNGISNVEIPFPYYVRITVKDVSNASVNLALREGGVRVREIKRKTISKELASLAIKTSFVTEHKIKGALDGLKTHDWFIELNNLMPIFDPKISERKRRIIVQKFGGTSVETVEHIKNVANKIVKTKHKGNDVVAVVSAMGGTTDDLVNLAHQVTNKPDLRELDVLLSTGEQVSMSLLAMAIQDMGEKAVSFTGSQISIITDKSHTMAKVIGMDDRKIIEALEEEKIPIVAGFQGITQEGDITTLGRGGSDITAVALAYILGASRCEIYTDVEGVMTADPKVVPNAVVIDELSYDEMIEMSYHGAYVMQARSIEFARRYGVEIVVRNSFSDFRGTKIKEENDMEEPIIKAVVHDVNIAKIVVEDVPDQPGIAAALFKRLAEVQVTIDMIVQSMHHGGKNDIAFTINRDDLKRAKNALKGFKEEVEARDVVYEEGVAKISLVGTNIVQDPKIAMGMFESLAKAKINIDMISSTGSKISCIVDENKVKEGVRIVHDHFKLGER